MLRAPNQRHLQDYTKMPAKQPVLVLGTTPTTDLLLSLRHQMPVQELRHETHADVGAPAGGHDCVLERTWFTLAAASLPHVEGAIRAGL